MNLDVRHINQTLANTVWMLWDKVFLLLLSLFVTVKVANYYGATLYGSYQYAVSLLVLFDMFTNFVDARIIKKKYSIENAEDVVWNASILRFLLTIGTISTCIIYILITRCWNNTEYFKIIVILLINTIILNWRYEMMNRYAYLLKAKKIILANNISLIIGAFFQLSAISMHLSIATIALITLLSTILSTILLYAQYRKDFGRVLQGKYNPKLFHDLFMESIPLAITTCTAVIYSRCDELMIGLQLTPEQVGIYSIAIKIATVLQICVSPIRESIYPKLINLYRQDIKEYKKLYIQITSTLCWICIMGTGISIILLPYAFQFLNSEYKEAFPVYLIYTIAVFFIYTGALRDGHYALIGKGQLLIITQLTGVIINILLNYTLIKSMGMYGAAIATAITQGINLFISNFFLGKDGKEVFQWQLKSMNPIYMVQLIKKILTK